MATTKLKGSNNQKERGYLLPGEDIQHSCTDEEIERIVDGFIKGFPKFRENLVEDNGPNTTRVFSLYRFMKKGWGEKRMKNASKTIGNIIDASNVSIISSVDSNGFPNTKAMLPPRKRVGITKLYFTTNTSSMRVKHYSENPKACIYFFHKRFYKGIMLKGTMEVLQDAKSKKMIWKEGDEMYYSRGVSDPDYCVLKFTAHEGRYYSNFKSESFMID